MSFWGVEVKPGKPYTHIHDFARGTLRITQAALGNGKSTKRSVMQCTVGSKSPIILCSLLPINSESLMLDLEFEEVDEVVFSVLGLRSIHLSGYFSGPSGYNDGDDTNLYGEEDIAELENDESGSFNSEDGFDKDFIDDDHIEMFPPSPRPNSGVVIEEIIDEEKPENGTRKQILGKTDQVMIDLDNDNVGSECQIIVKQNHVHDSESEDEDGFPISLSYDKKTNLENIKERENGDVILDVSRQGEEENIDRDSVLERESDQDENMNQKIANSEKKKKKKRKKGEIVESMSDASVGKNAVKIDKKAANNVDSDLILEASKDLNREIKKKRAKVDVFQNGELHTEILEGDRNLNITKPLNKPKEDKPTLNDSTANKEFDLIKPDEKNDSVSDVMTVLEGNFQPLKTRSFPNGLTIEELSMGKPDGKRASNGQKVSVNYIGKLRNGTIFDSNIGNQPFQFRLGVGQVIKGWDVGVNGMRIGDKRRLTIPSSMGYGSRDVEEIPADSWLIFEVGLVDVK